jgi:hypothetical protein
MPCGAVPTQRYSRATGSSTHRAKSAGPTLLPHRIVVTRRPANRSGSSRRAATPSAGRRLDDESRVLIEHPHADLDRLLANEHHVVEHDEQVVQHLGDRAAPAVGDRLDAVRLDHRSTTPRQRHRGRTTGLDSIHLEVRGERPHGVSNAAGHRSAADSHEYDVELRIVSCELETDCGSVLAGRQVQLSSTHRAARLRRRRRSGAA